MPVGPERRCQRPREAFDSRLGRSVHGIQGPTRTCHDRADVDDAAGATQVRDHGLGKEKCGAQVDVDAVVEIRMGGLEERLANPRSGVVHEDVDGGAKGGQCGVDDDLWGRGVRKIDLDLGRTGVVVQGIDLGNEGISCWGARIRYVGDGDLCGLLITY